MNSTTFGAKKAADCSRNVGEDPCRDAGRGNAIWEGVGTCGIHDGIVITKVGVQVDSRLDFLKGKIVPLNIEGSKGGMLAGGKHMILVVTGVVPKLVTDVTAVSAIVSSCSGVGAVNILGSGSCPEGPKFDLQDVPESIVGAGVQGASTEGCEGAYCVILEASIGFCMCRVL